jgi:acylphosphatase
MAVQGAAQTRRIRARVHGRVQGVSFRESTRRTASGLGLCGRVRNCADGTVELVAEGSAEAIAALLEFLRVGPPRARVDRLEVADEAPAGEFSDFAVA